VLEIDKGVSRPQNAPEIFPADQFTGMFEEVDKDAERLLANLDADAIAAQFEIRRINLEYAKAPPPGAFLQGFHGGNLPTEVPFA
jgi:hypothetical protein